MKYWYWFWIANFLVAGSAFAIIAAIVFVRGARDLREMFVSLRASQQKAK
jgi:hypothetical protein